jgi:hypothetical protein
MTRMLFEWVRLFRRTIIYGALLSVALVFLTLAVAAFVGGIGWWKGFIPAAFVTAIIALIYKERTDVDVNDEWLNVGNCDAFWMAGPKETGMGPVKVLTKVKPNEVKSRTQLHAYRAIKRSAVIAILGCIFVAYMATMFSAVTSDPPTPSPTPSTYPTFNYNSVSPALP